MEEGLGERCAGVEIGPGSVLMWRGCVISAWVEVVHGCIDVEGGIGSAL